MPGGNQGHLDKACPDYDAALKRGRTYAEA